MTKDTQDNAPERLRVMVVDDHALFRRGLEMVLGDEPDIELVGEASDGAEAVERALEIMPDIVLMDVRMPRLPPEGDPDRGGRGRDQERPRRPVQDLALDGVEALDGVRRDLQGDRRAPADAHAPADGP